MTKKLLLTIALLCAVAQGSWAQNWSVWDGHTSTCPTHYSQHWNGTEWVLNTIQIYSADELAYIRDHWTDSPDDWVNTDKDFHEISYELYADLDMTAANWTPMGSANYTGALYGNGHTIRYKIDDSSISSNYQGLFETIGSDGSVNDLHVDCYIKVGNASNVAGICGENEGTIRNCWVSGHIESNHYSAYDADLGGIAGLNDNSGTTKYCCVTADVKNTNGNSGVGGIAGSNEGTIQHVTFYGEVSVEHAQDNKYVGDQDGTLEYYYDTFNQDEYNAASGNDVYCDAILHPYATIINSVGNGVIVANPARTYANQTVTLTVTSGLLETISIKDSDGNNVSYSGNAASGFTFTMQHRDIIVTTQFDTTDWDDENLGTENNPYIIDKNDEWTDFVNHVNNGNSYSGKYVKLTTNISINSMAGSYQSDDNYQPFSGTFDGDGHTLTFNKSDFTDIYAAPFRCVGSASFRNLHVAGTINTTYQYAGGMIAWIVNGNTVSIQNCRSSMTINSSNNTNGGFVSRLGDNATLTISGCVFDGSFEGTGHANGGFIGYCQGGSSATLVDCLFKPNHISCDLTSCQTFSRGVEATLTRCYCTQTLGTPQGWLAYATEPSVGFYISVTAADGNTYYGVIGVETGNQSYKTYQISEDMEIPLRIIASGNVTLNLGEGTTLHAPKGIDMSNGSSLTINGPGTITIDNCDNFMAGIGLSSTGVLTINSGVVNVTGGEEEGAGIGGNNLGNGSCVIIHGGVVNAVGGWGGAGIGGNKLGNGGNVIIHGGVVNATGGEGGPGIGSGADFSINNSQNHPCGDVVITGGQVTAIGNKVYGIGPGAAHVGEYHNGTLQLSWTNTDDFVFISTASDVSYTKRTLSSITFENGKQFYLEHAAAIATESNLYGYKLLPYTGTLPSLAGTGTAGDPFLINNHDDWLLFYWYVNSGTNSYSGQYVKLMTDLTITTTIGFRDDKPFSGTFLGNGHTLTANLTGTIYDLDVNNEQGTAPFHYIKNATIKDLTIAGNTYSTSQHAGGLVGFADGTNLIEGCIVTSTLHLSNKYAGGIIAHGLNSTTTLRDCVFAGTITSYYENSVYTGNNVIEIGGIWGWGDNGTPTLVNCLEKGSYDNIKSMHPMGLQGNKGTITNCYYVNQQIGSPTNACTVSGAYKVENSLSGLCKKITIEGFTVYSHSCTVSGVEANYFMTENPINVDPVITDPFGTTLNFDTDYTVTLDGESVEALPISISTTGSHTLVFTGKGSYVGTKSVETYLINSLNGTGSDTDPYIINNTDEWNTFAYFVNNGFNNYNGEFVRLDANINISQTVGLRDNKPFSGTFLGNDHTITASINSTTTGTGANEQGVAPFHYINGATIKDLKVAGTIASASYHTSGLVGFANGTNTIENCLVTATINISSNYAGGIIGHGLESNTTIRGCVFNGTINGMDGDRSNIGGIWGWSTSSPVLENCLEAGTYTNIASMHPMGLQGGSGTITNCYYVNPQIGSPTNVCTVSGAAPGNERMIAGYGEGNDKWAFIASPLTANTDPTTVQNLISASEYDLYQLNPGTMMWENYKQHEGNAASGFSLENGRGYLYATQSEQAIKFSGANASAYNLDNTKEVTLQQGFNLVGNPFPRAAYINRSYYTLNSDGSAVSTTPSTEYIPPCHAVVVEATNSESLTFSTKPLAQQSTGNNGGLQIALSQTVATRGGAEAKTIDNAIVTFNEGMELGKFYFGNQNANIYLPQNGKEYAVAFSEGQGEMPLNFEAKENGTYTISVNPEGVDMQYLHLIDNMTGADIDLLQMPTYTFTAKTSDYASRFRLVFAAQSSEASEGADPTFAFFSNGNWIILNEGKATLQVIDLNGRILRSETINGCVSKAINVAAGIYILRLIDGKEARTQKIVIQ